jgi:hypothetical protein
MEIRLSQEGHIAVAVIIVILFPSPSSSSASASSFSISQPGSDCNALTAWTRHLRNRNRGVVLIRSRYVAYNREGLGETCLLSRTSLSPGRSHPVCGYSPPPPRRTVQPHASAQHPFAKANACARAISNLRKKRLNAWRRSARWRTWKANGCTLSRYKAGWGEVKLISTMGVVAVCLAIFVYGHVLSMRLAALVFLLLAAFLVYLVFIWPNLRRRE